MKDEAIFFILKFSPSDWFNYYGIDEAEVNEFILWLWGEIELVEGSIGESWVEVKVTEFKSK